jgi:hypothetical protein
LIWGEGYTGQGQYTKFIARDDGTINYFNGLSAHESDDGSVIYFTVRDDNYQFQTYQYLDSPGVFVLSTQQIKALTTSQITALSTQDLMSMSTSQLSVFSTGQIKSLNSAQLASLSSADIAAFGLTTTQLTALTTAALSGLTNDQIQSIGSLKYLTPIVLDLNGNGINTVSAQNGTVFDIDNNGKTEKTGWVTGGDGLLVRDLSGDGIINNGAELFGEGTALANGSKAKDGYQAMRELDTNHDGILDVNDAAFQQLGVWVDNGNGQTDAGELKTLSDLGVSSVSLASVETSLVDQGNLIGLMGSYTTEDGMTHTMGDVWFSVDQSGKRTFDLASIVAASDATANQGAVHLSAANSQTLSVGLNDVLSLGETDIFGSHQLVIDGGDTNSLDLADSEQWASAGQVDMGGDNYLVYVDTIHQARLLVNDKIHLIM